MGLWTLQLQWRPGIGPPHKADNPGIRTTFFQSQIFPHSHNVLSDSESGPTRDSGHGPPFFSPKSQKDSKNGPAKKIIHTFTVIYASIKGPAADGFTNGTSCN